VRTFLIPLDESELSERVLPYAEELVRTTDGRLVLMEAVARRRRQEYDDRGYGDGPPGPADADAAERHLARLEEREHRLGLAAEGMVREGPPVAAILIAAEEARADAIVMGTRARGALGRLLAGSVADGVSRRARVPVLLVPPDARPPFPVGGPARVLVSVDGSTLAEEVLGPAVETARALDADVLLLRVVEPPTPNYVAKGGYGACVRVQVGDEFAIARRYVHDRARDLRTAGVAATGAVRVGDPADEIVRVAAEKGASVVAMATHGRGGLTRLLVGSVAAAVLPRLAVPLLLVRSASGSDDPSEAEVAAVASVAEHGVVVRRR
jgi:nucleotide-binding universal stress UspA family protein